MAFPLYNISNALSVTLDLKSAISSFISSPICVTSSAGPVPWLHMSSCVLINNSLFTVVILWITSLKLKEPSIIKSPVMVTFLLNETSDKNFILFPELTLRLFTDKSFVFTFCLNVSKSPDSV